MRIELHGRDLPVEAILHRYESAADVKVGEKGCLRAEKGLFEGGFGVGLGLSSFFPPLKRPLTPCRCPSRCWPP